ncbi:MAG: SMP-30/gluconolactonase/LRE family protein, partial [Limisphaerales bacterium]
MRVVLSPTGFPGLLLAGFMLFTALTANAVRFQISDPVEFNKIIDTNAVFTTNVTVNSWIEGPVWLPASNCLVFSDRDNNKLRRLDPPGTLSDFLLPPAQVKYNGNFLDLQERLVSCECGSNGLKVVLTTNGVITPLVTDYYGLKFYSPNDLIVKSDGSIWFTDPGYD